MSRERLHAAGLASVKEHGPRHASGQCNGCDYGIEVESPDAVDRVVARLMGHVQDEHPVAARALEGST